MRLLLINPKFPESFWSFKWVFIGIESPDEESLKETKKFQNTREDILSSVRKIYSHGVEILGGFIIGFDNDTMDTFHRQYRFITQSGIQAAMIGLLVALPKTPLYERLEKEGRLIPERNNSDNTRLGTNVNPKHMGYEEMVSGYHALHNRLLEPRNIADRIKNKLRYLTDPVYANEYSLREMIGVLRRFFVNGLIPGGFTQVLHFFRTIPFSGPRLIPLVIKDWIIGLSMVPKTD